VTTENLRRLRAMNFGCRTLQEVHDPDRIRKEIQCYDANDAGRVSDAVRHSESLQSAAERMVAIYGEAIRLHPESGSEGIEEERISTARFLESIAPFSNTQYIRHREIAAAQSSRAESAALRAFVQAITMLPLEKHEQRELGLSDGFAPDVITMTDPVSAIVEVHNRTAKLISSQPPCPVHISYHWMSPEGGMLLAEGLRTRLLPPLAPGERRKYPLNVQPPSDPGDWILRITLVQESVAWFDDCGLQCLVDLPITVC
jgi:hypothetical protein